MARAAPAVLLAALAAASAAAAPPSDAPHPLEAVRPLDAAARAGLDDPAAVVDACVAEALGDTRTPGAAVAVLDDGVLVHAAGHGYRRRGQPATVTPTTRFRIGSVTKQLTAAAVLQQVEAGTLRLDDPLTTWAPELAESGRWDLDRVTVRHLLTHTSALPDRFPGDDLAWDSDEGALGRWAGGLDPLWLHAPAGTFYNYSNPNFAFAGLVAERAAGVPYRALMATRVLAPSGMTDSTFDPQAVLASGDYAWGHATPFTYSPDSYDNGPAAPAGYLFSTAPDLVRWADLLMQGGGAVLGPEAAAALQAPQVATDYLPGAAYGFGVAVDAYRGLDLRSHGGSIPGWSAFLAWVPSEGFAVAVLANASAPLTAVALCAVDAYLAPPASPPADYSTDPATWRRYAGVYPMRMMDGEDLEAVVTADGHGLTLTFPSIGDPFRPGQPYATEAEQLLLDTFLVDLDGDGLRESDITFLDRRHGPMRRLWLRWRYGVGWRAGHGTALTAAGASTPPALR